ncbi:MAG: 2'-5' RNA ligase family protein [Clostridiaceae bacterium]|nr:2'-5' RNA ligase family protein [Clostridiaceae bacterium]
MLRSIFLLPTFTGIEDIREIRKQYDPLADCIPPHITIVFPFESDLSTEQIQQHLAENLLGYRQFDFSLTGFTGDFRDGYIFLNVEKGKEEIIQIHNILYSGNLRSQLDSSRSYVPHLTVGRIKNQEDFLRAISRLPDDINYEGVINKVYVEQIDAKENSIIEYCHSLAE